MAKSRISVKQKKRGRPVTTGTTPIVALRLSPEMQKKIDDWAAEQPEPISRSEAIRRILTEYYREKEGPK